MTDWHGTGTFAVVRWPKQASSLERRVTLAVSGLLLVVLAGMFWLSHSRVVDAISNSEMARLQTSGGELARVIQAQAQRLVQDAARIAGHGALRDALVSKTAAARSAADAILDAERAVSPNIHHLTVVDHTGRVVASSGNFAGTTEQPDIAARLETVTDGTLSPLRTSGDTVLYSVTAPIRQPNGVRTGYVVITRILSNSSAFANLIGGLVGHDAQVLLGNTDGDVISDLSRAIPRGVYAAPGTAARYRDHTGRDLIGASVAVPETPWMIVVQSPRKVSLDAARQFTTDIALLGGVLVILGALVSWVLIRRTMRPLGEVTGAAREVAEGNLSRRAMVRGRSEIAMLADAFNQMVERVGRSAEDLAARAAQLERSNKELNDSEARYRSLFEHLPDGILVHRNDRVLFANPAAVRLLGYESESEIADRQVLEFVAPQDRDVVRGRIGHVVNEASAAPTLEVRVQRAGGKVVTVEATSMPLRIDGGPAVQTVLHDVSERRQLEEQFRQSQKMDAVGRLAGGVAHDFNNLLTVIQAHAEFALGDGESDEDRRKDIEEIRKTAESAARLTRQLLTFSRKQAVSPAHLDLNDAIAGMLGMIRRLIGDNIEVVTVAGEDLEGIWADPGQIQQVLLNLAVNARDAMPEGGVLRLETANMTVGEGYMGAAASVIPPGPYVMLAVQDTGIGMTEEVRSRVFEPFFTTKQPGRGTGLGLSTVYGIVKQSGGHIWVYSEPGLGTAFKVLFPPHRELGAAPVHEIGAPGATEVHRGHLLVVEDDVSVRGAVVRALRGAGYAITEASDADEGMRALRADNGIDLLITDMVMPGRPGIELLADARVLRPRLPAIVLSGYSEGSAHDLWRVPDHAIFVEKPVSPAELIRRVSQMLAARD